MKRLLSIFVLFALAACGGGGGGSNSGGTSNVDPSGIWQGNFHSNSTGQTFTLDGIVIGTGEARFFAPGASVQYIGSVSTSGNNLSGTATGYGSNGPFETISISGTVQAKSSMSGTYTASPNGDTGTFSLTYYDSLYDRSSSLSLLAANWTGLTPYGYSMSCSIDSNGNITGGDTSGCIYNGAVSIIDPAHDAYRVNLTLSSCGQWNGSYSGLGVLADTNIANDTFLFNFSNNTTAITDEIYKQ